MAGKREHVRELFDTRFRKYKTPAVSSKSMRITWLLVALSLVMVKTALVMPNPR